MILILIVILFVAVIMTIRAAVWFLDEVSEYERQCDPNWIGYEIIGYIAILSAICGLVYWAIN